MRPCVLMVVWTCLSLTARGNAKSNSSSLHSTIVPSSLSPSATVRPTPFSSVGPSTTVRPAPFSSAGPSTTVRPAPFSSAGPSPTPLPPPLVDDLFRVRFVGENRTCILMAAEIAVNVKYPAKENGTITTKMVTLDITNDTRPHVNTNLSYCDTHSRNANMTIVWGTGNKTHQLIFAFKKEKVMWELHHLRLILNANSSDFPGIFISGNSTMVVTQYNSVFFTNEYQRSYKCNPTSTITFATDDSTSFNETTFKTSVRLSGWRVQAFDFRRDGKFGNARLCAKSAPSDVNVPIGVGVALGVLLVGVFVVYMASRIRKRKRLTSYESLN